MSRWMPLLLTTVHAAAAAATTAGVAVSSAALLLLIVRGGRHGRVDAKEVEEVRQRRLRHASENAGRHHIHGQEVSISRAMRADRQAAEEGRSAGGRRDEELSSARGCR